MSYRDKIYSKYISTHIAQLNEGRIPTVEEIKKQVPNLKACFNKFLPKDKNARILDLGCGYGRFIYWLQQLGYKNVEGIDASIEQVEVARKMGIKNIYQSDIRKFLENLNTNNKPIDKYDAIFMIDVIEHFNKKEVLSILKLVFNALKKNGILVIRTPNAESPFSGRGRYIDFSHEINFTEHSLQQILLISGFKNVNLYPTRPAVYSLKSLIRAIFWRLFEYIFRFYFWVETGSTKGIFTRNLIASCSK